MTMEMSKCLAKKRGRSGLWKETEIIIAFISPVEYNVLRKR